MKVNKQEHFIEKIKSEIGFFIGDPMYVLDDEDWDDLWDEYSSKDGKLYTDDIDVWDDRALLVAQTDENNSWFNDNYENRYEIESRTIGVVPLENCDEEKIDNLSKEQGFIFRFPGKAFMEAENGEICINLPGGLEINIDTNLDRGSCSYNYHLL